MESAELRPSLACPLCQGWLDVRLHAYCCDPCGRRYPVLCGIPDLRLRPDPYLSMEEDRRKGLALFEGAAGRGFEEMLDLYWSLTPETPARLARKFKEHALADAAIAEAALAEMAAPPARGLLLDAGCSTGGLLIAAAPRFGGVAGVDAAFRWLVIASIRLRQAGVSAPLICANAESLPFADNTFAAVTATDLVEHVADPALVFSECRRVLEPGGQSYFSTNNRYSLLPEPHAGVWGVGWLPRSVQAGWVRTTTGRSYRHITLRSAQELAQWARQAGWRDCRLDPAPLRAPGRAQWPQTAYNRMRRWPGFGELLRRLGPRLQLSCRK